MVKILKIITAEFIQLFNQEEQRFQRFEEKDRLSILAKKINKEHCDKGDHRMFRIRPDLIQCLDCGLYKKCDMGFCNECKLECSNSINRKLPEE